MSKGKYYWGNKVGIRTEMGVKASPKIVSFACLGVEEGTVTLGPATTRASTISALAFVSCFLMISSGLCLVHASGGAEIIMALEIQL